MKTRSDLTSAVTHPRSSDSTAFEPQQMARGSPSSDRESHSFFSGAHHQSFRDVDARAAGQNMYNATVNVTFPPSPPHREEPNTQGNVTQNPSPSPGLPAPHVDPQVSSLSSVRVRNCFQFLLFRVLSFFGARDGGTNQELETKCGEDAEENVEATTITSSESGDDTCNTLGRAPQDDPSVVRTHLLMHVWATEALAHSHRSRTPTIVPQIGMIWMFPMCTFGACSNPGEGCPAGSPSLADLQSGNTVLFLATSGSSTRWTDSRRFSTSGTTNGRTMGVIQCRRRPLKYATMC